MRKLITALKLLYFAAQAPEEIPGWFEPRLHVPLPHPPDIPFEHLPAGATDEETDLASKNNHALNLCAAWRMDDFDLEDAIERDMEKGYLTAEHAARVLMFAAGVEHYRELQKAYDKLRMYARIGQWPWKWASLVVNSEADCIER